MQPFHPNAPALDESPQTSTSTSATLATRFGRLIRSRVVLVTLCVLVLASVAGTTVGYAAMSKTVTVTVDGEPREVSLMGDTVSDVLEAADLEVGERDLVAPDPDESVSEGSEITVRYSRPIELTVDGETETHWVTATSVQGALSQIGTTFGRSLLSLNRGLDVPRDGLALEVVTPKRITVGLAGRNVRLAGARLRARPRDRSRDRRISMAARSRSAIRSARPAPGSPASRAALLKREGRRFGLATQCIGGGQGIATVLEAV